MSLIDDVFVEDVLALLVYAVLLMISKLYYKHRQLKKEKKNERP